MPCTDVHDASEGYASALSSKHSLERSSRGAPSEVYYDIEPDFIDSLDDHDE